METAVTLAAVTAALIAGSAHAHETTPDGHILLVCEFQKGETERWYPDGHREKTAANGQRGNMFTPTTTFDIDLVGKTFATNPMGLHGKDDEIHVSAGFIVIFESNPDGGMTIRINRATGEMELHGWHQPYSNQKCNDAVARAKGPPEHAREIVEESKPWCRSLDFKDVYVCRSAAQKF